LREDNILELESHNVEKIYKEYKQSGSHRRDDSFAVLYLKEQFDLSDEQLERQVAHGGNQFGIDAWHFDAERHNLYIYQFKWTADHSKFRESLKNLNSKGIEFLFGDERQVESPDQFLLQMRSMINENRSIIDQVMIHFVFDGNLSEVDQSPVISGLLEVLEGKKYIVDDFFGNRSARLMLEFRSNRSDSVATIARTVKTHKYQIDFNRSILSETPAGEQMQIGFIRLVDLCDMYEDMGPRFFDKNIRSGLSSDKPTNKSLQKTFHKIVVQEKMDPEAFLFCHNGITIAAEQLEVKQGAAYITEPRLLNGAQTVTSLVRFIQENKGNEDFEANLNLLDRIRVIGKVVSSAKDEFVSNVTICNNRQNPVEPWNLRANDTIQLEFQEKFRSDLEIYYERQEGAFLNLSEDDLDELGVRETKAIQLKRLAQTLLAAQGEIDKMSRLRDVFEGEVMYRATFKESYLKADARKILLAYKIQFRINAVTREIVDRYPTKYHYLGRARNLVWSLLVQGLLNDPRFELMLEKYGDSLTMEVEFTELLKEIASKRIRIIIGELAAGERYIEFIELGKYGFLRTRATFQRCMEIAAERFQWSKKSLI
jgi:hypothetical protein